MGLKDLKNLDITKVNFVYKQKGGLILHECVYR